MFRKKEPKLLFDKNPSFDRIIRYLEGDMSGTEKAFVRQRLEESQEWKKEHQKALQFLNRLQKIPLQSPPDRVWDAVLQSVQKTKQKKIWFPWFYSNPVWPLAMRGATAGALVLLTTICLWISASNPYRVIVVEDSNGFGTEADSYVVHHDLSREPAIAGETIVASYYTADWQQ